MKKGYTTILLLLISFSSINAQITDFITGVSTRKIIIDGDYLFYISNSGSEQTIYRTDISDLAFPSTLPLHTEDDVLRGMIGLAKNGNDLYFGLFNPISALGGLKKIDLTDLGASAIELNTNAGYDLAFNSNTLFSVAREIYTNVLSTNTLLSPPITSVFYEDMSADGEANSLHINGFTLYIGSGSGKIYTKNLLTGGAKNLLYTNTSGDKIDEILKFEGQLYFSDSEGVHRFNPLDPSPSIQTIADDSELDNFAIGMAAKSYISGENYLFVSDYANKIIKIDLNDPTLSIKETITNKFAVYPNPVLNTVTIKTSSNIEEISLYDMLGKRVYNVSISNQVFEYSIDISSLNSGVYNLEIETSKGTESKKIIKR